MSFLVITTEEVAIAPPSNHTDLSVIYPVTIFSPVNIRANVQEPLDQGGVLSHTAHVQNILPVILLRQVNVIQEQGIPLQHPTYFLSAKIDEQQNDPLSFSDILKSHARS